MFDWIIHLVSGLSIAIGCVFIVSGGVGLIRMPDLYTRLHAGSVTDTGGAMFIVFGLLLQALFIFHNPMAAIKVLLVLIFTLFTAPTASHALAKTALLSGHVPTDKNGKPLLDSPDKARMIARSRPES